MKIKHVYLTTRDPERLGGFYSQIGLEMRFADADRWLQFATQGAAFCISGPTESATSPSSNAVVVFEVADIEETLAQAKAAGASAVFATRDMGGHGKVAGFLDIDGNTIQLFQAAKRDHE